MVGTEAGKDWKSLGRGNMIKIYFMKKLIKNPDESCLIDENVENTFEFNVI